MAEKFIVKYVRDNKDNSPIGCIVAVSRKDFGACFLNKVDRPKSRKELLELALERAKDPNFVTDMCQTDRSDVEKWKVPHCMREFYKRMVTRSERYFK